MKNLNLSALKIAIVAVLLPAIFMMSCKKEQKAVGIDEKKDFSIAELKGFLAKEGHVTYESIGYDEQKEQFIWQGKVQISKTELLNMFNQHTHKN